GIASEKRAKADPGHDHEPEEQRDLAVRPTILHEEDYALSLSFELQQLMQITGLGSVLLLHETDSGGVVRSGSQETYTSTRGSVPSSSSLEPVWLFPKGAACVLEVSGLGFLAFSGSELTETLSFSRTT
ncbi:hypothetical protein BaRGS_00012550, partial [Batillaria attramentaria]